MSASILMSSPSRPASKPWQEDPCPWCWGAGKVWEPPDGIELVDAAGEPAFYGVTREGKFALPLGRLVDFGLPVQCPQCFGTRGRM